MNSLIIARGLKSYWENMLGLCQRQVARIKSRSEGALQWRKIITFHSKVFVTMQKSDKWKFSSMQL